MTLGKFHVKRLLSSQTYCGVKQQHTVPQATNFRLPEPLTFGFLSRKLGTWGSGKLAASQAANLPLEKPLSGQFASRFSG